MQANMLEPSNMAYAFSTCKRCVEGCSGQGLGDEVMVGLPVQPADFSKLTNWLFPVEGKADGNMPLSWLAGTCPGSQTNYKVVF